MQKIRIWDLPLRLFHWLLVCSVVAAYVAIKTGNTEWHLRFGFITLALILFRIVWGFIGGRQARFATFAASPSRALRSLSGPSSSSESAGHSPLASYSVFAMLLMIGLQAVFGLFANDDISTEGPLSKYASGAVVTWMTRLHHWNQWVLIALIVLHLLAIVYYTLRRRRLVGPMVTGDKPAGEGVGPADASRDDVASRLLALAVAVAAMLLVGWISKL